MNFKIDDGPRSLEVSLIPIHDDVLVSNIEQVRRLLTPRLDGRLHIGLLSIYIQRAVPLTSELANINESLRHLVEDIQVVLGKAGSTAKSNLSEEVRSFVLSQLEKMAVHIDFKAG